MTHWWALFPRSFYAYFCIAGAVAGAAIYAVMRVASSRDDARPGADSAVRSRPRAMLALDAALGAAGFVAGVVGSALVRITPSTVTSRVGGVVVRKTSMHFQHPYTAALILALALPLLAEAVRALTSRQKKTVTSAR